MSTPGPRTRAAGRRAQRRAASAVQPVDEARATPRPVVTGRAVVLAGVFGLLVFTLAVPARTLLAQRAELGALRDEVTQSADRVAQLQAEQTRLADPAYVKSLVRDRLHYVLPGEVGYVVLGPDQAPAPLPAGQVTRTPWYDQLWDSVRAADGEPAPDDPNRVTIRPDAPR